MGESTSREPQGRDELASNLHQDRLENWCHPSGAETILDSVQTYVTLRMVGVAVLLCGS
jgi:hypothetical protein